MVRLIALTHRVAAVPVLAPQREWLDRLAFVIPGNAATRWLLVADVVCLAVVGLTVRRSPLAVVVALAIGFTVLNALGMVLLDFYLGLAAFHLIVGATALAVVRSRRWIGAALIVVALTLGVLT